MKKKDDKARKEAFDALYANAHEALMDMRILDAVELMRSMQKCFVDEAELWEELSNILDTLESDYKAVLHFVASNGKDEDMDRIHMNIGRRVLDVINQMHRHLRMELTTEIYSLTGQHCSVADTSEWLGKAMEHMETVSEMGYANTILTCFWTSDLFMKEERERLESLLDGASVDWQTLVLGGIFLSLTEYFDPHKYLLLYHFTGSRHATVRVDATIYLLLIRVMQADYLKFVPLLPKLGKDKRTMVHVIEAQRAMLVQAESPNCSSIVAEKVKETVETPGGSVGIVNQIVDLPIPTQIDFNFRSFVPVYGSDFFRKNPAMWWMPFSIDSPFVSPSVKKLKTEANPLINSIFCDVDKFAICECLDKGHLPGMQSAGKMTDQGGIFAQVLGIEATDLADLCSLRMQNLYRFYTYCFWSHQMKNPFNYNLYLAKDEELAPYFSENERMVLMHSLVVMHDYKLAIEVGDDLIAHFKCPPVVFRAKGVCYQKLRQYENALQAYRQVLLMDEKDVWCLTHMQECCEHLGLRQEVVDCLVARLRLQPKLEDELTARLARAYKELEQYDKALSCYYKMYYKDAGNTEASGGVVWCLFMQKKYDKARRELHNIADHTVGLTDYECLVAGHLEFVCGDLKAALDHYGSFFSLYRCRKGRDDTSAWKVMERSWPVLARHGVTRSNFRLLMDILEKK